MGWVNTLAHFGHTASITLVYEKKFLKNLRTVLGSEEFCKKVDDGPEAGVTLRYVA